MDLNPRSYHQLAGVTGVLQCPCYRTRYGKPVCLQQVFFPDASGRCHGCPESHTTLSEAFCEHHGEVREEYHGQNPHR